LTTVRQTLERLTATEPAPPDDWARPANVACKCRFCLQLNTFLSDPLNRVGRIAAREDERRHGIGKIEEFQCDVTHKLEKKGSPYTLVLTKTTGSYERALNQFQADQKLLKELPPGNGV